jgi:sulfur carrier protein ThiS
MKITVRSMPRGEVDTSIELPKGAIIIDLLKALNLRPDNWIASRDGRAIPDDSPLADGDSIKLLSVVSGG